MKRDLEDLLDSAAIARSVILIHDTANERVRQGVDSVRFATWPKVAHVDLDWIPGQLFAEPAVHNELWYGLGLVLVDSSRLAYRNGSVYERRYHPAAQLLAEMRELVLARELAPEVLQRSPLVEAIDLRKRLVRLGAELSAARTYEGELLGEVMRLRDELDGAPRAQVSRAERALEDIKGSASWKATEPLRTAKRRVARHKS